MSIVENIPLWMRTIYRLLGVVQFSYKTPTSFSRCIPRIYCIPVFILYGYCCYSYYSIKFMLRNTIVQKVDFIISSVGVLSTTTSLLLFGLRSSKLKLLLLTLDKLKSHSLHEIRQKNYLKNISLVIILLHVLLSLIFPTVFIREVYYFMPVTVGLFDHLFLNEILESVRAEFAIINEELSRHALFTRIITITADGTIQQQSKKEIDFTLRRVEEVILRHCDLVSLVFNINKLFSITTVASMITWFVYVTDIIYYFLQTTAGSKLSLQDWIFISTNASLFFLWLPIMVRMYSRVQKEANETSAFVHDLWNGCSKTEDKDRKIYHLELVSLRLLNNKLYLTANSFFYLDETFCHTMVAAVATYVIILFQF
ncbi:hypothetical protein Zmor_014565 [Zophobas morio]|uniref:Gustatory receptor n=1 Tax=Zophobas morio TaxID=2755281 RepID=A0AA38MGK5_9CUCU|nr:hypothetical protein Zmor_014565 [Zophobas morio]